MPDAGRASRASTQAKRHQTQPSSSPSHSLYLEDYLYLFQLRVPQQQLSLFSEALPGSPRQQECCRILRSLLRVFLPLP